MRGRFVVFAALAAMFVLGAVSADAALVLSLDDTAMGQAGVAEVIIVDGSLAGTSTPFGLSTHDDADGNVDGSILFSTGTSPMVAGSSWKITAAAGLSKPNLGELVFGVVDMVLLATSTSSGTLMLHTTDTDFNPDGVSFGGGLVANIGGTTNGTVSFDAWFDAGNAEFGGSPLAGTGSVSGPVAFAETFSIPVGQVSGPYSLTERVVVTHTGAAGTSFNAELKMVPEPATIVIWSTLGLFGIALAWRRRKAS